jgi:L-methionine (R)-S-oxide reductase
MSDLQSRLAAFLEAHGAVAGTVHRLEDGALRLAAHHHIPPAVVERTRVIPEGKGMAGLAWQRGVPVQTCDLQADPTGDVQPGARAVDAGSAVALPVGRPLRGVVGAAFATTGDLPDDRVQALARDAEELLG